MKKGGSISSEAVNKNVNFDNIDKYVYDSATSCGGSLSSQNVLKHVNNSSYSRMNSSMTKGGSAASDSVFSSVDPGAFKNLNDMATNQFTTPMKVNVFKGGSLISSSMFDTKYRLVHQKGGAECSACDAVSNKTEPDLTWLPLSTASRHGSMDVGSMPLGTVSVLSQHISSQQPADSYVTIPNTYKAFSPLLTGGRKRKSVVNPEY